MAKISGSITLENCSRTKKNMLALLDDDGVSYDPTPYESLGYRVPSPVDEWKSSGFVSSAKTGTGSEGGTFKSSSVTANNR